MIDYTEIVEHLLDHEGPEGTPEPGTADAVRALLAEFLSDGPRVFREAERARRKRKGKSKGQGKRRQRSGGGRPRRGTKEEATARSEPEDEAAEETVDPLGEWPEAEEGKQKAKKKSKKKSKKRSKKKSKSKKSRKKKKEEVERKGDLEIPVFHRDDDGQGGRKSKGRRKKKKKKRSKKRSKKKEQKKKEKKKKPARASRDSGPEAELDRDVVDDIADMDSVIGALGGKKGPGGKKEDSGGAVTYFDADDDEESKGKKAKASQGTGEERLPGPVGEEARASIIAVGAPEGFGEGLEAASDARSADHRTEDQARTDATPPVGLRASRRPEHERGPERSRFGSGLVDEESSTEEEEGEEALPQLLEPAEGMTREGTPSPEGLVGKPKGTRRRKVPARSDEAQAFATGLLPEEETEAATSEETPSEEEAATAEEEE